MRLQSGMHMQILVAQQALHQEQHLSDRLTEIERSMRRLQEERRRVVEKLAALRRTRTAPVTVDARLDVHCPKCGRDSDFLTDNGGYLGHVLEDPHDTENLEPGKPLFCPDCGEVFLFPRAQPKRR